MPKTSTLASLSETLRQKQVTELETVEKLTSQQLNTLASNLTSHTKNALTTTFSDIEKDLALKSKEVRSKVSQDISPLIKSLTEIRQFVETQNRLFRMRMAWMVGTILFLLLIISAGAWGLIAYLSNSIQSQLREIEVQRRTLSQLTNQTWGLQLHQDSQGQRFIIVPNTVTPATGWTFGSKPAIKLDTN